MAQRGGSQRSGAGRGGPRGARRPGPERQRTEDRFPPAPRIDQAAARARLREVIEPVVGAVGYDLEDVTLSRVGRRYLVRVLVDADGGVSLDAVAVVARAVSAALDRADETGGEILPGEYQLEVGSPGVDRPLTLPRHWRRNVGRLVKVRAGERQVTARVSAADAEGVVLAPEGGEPVEVEYGALGPGHVQVEFSRLAEISDEELAAAGADDEADTDDDDFEDDGETELEDEQR
ncbi:ribosome maturation factor RimP [Rhizomonospora bruguierae]|uniref:ribosome maturation factor RimP n=1 Tax=Rhizomonospora bruguierae TaxID=1581705 RepID=UPI001BCD4E19|nr:ribosome maturation factor RimP [Micromonospora sp. NBRC 107566]